MVLLVFARIILFMLVVSDKLMEKANSPILILKNIFIT